VEAVMQHGILKGFWLGVRRLSKCHPWGTSGYDPVPPPGVKVFHFKTIKPKNETEQ